jgi:hypothetical protein
MSRRFRDPERLMPPNRPVRDDKKGRGEPPVNPPGYADSAAHLLHHLQRIHLLVKAQTIRWRSTIAAGKPENLWGMVHVTDAEVQAFLDAPLGGNGDYPPEARKKLTELAADAAKMAAAIRAAESDTPPETPLRLRRLREVFALSEMECDVLLVCLLPEWDARYRRLYGYLQDDASRTQPAVELAAAILSPDGNGMAAVRPCFEGSRPLLSHRLVSIRSQADEPLPVRSLRLDDRIAAFLTGSGALDARLDELAGIADGLDWSGLTAEPQHIERLRHIVDWWQRQPPPAGAAVFLRGVYGSGRLDSARALATALSLPLLTVDVERAVRSQPGWEQIVFLAFRETLLRGAAVYWAGCETLLARDQPPGRWDDLLAAAEAFPGLVFFASQAAWETAGRFRGKTFLRLDLGIPGYALRRALWNAHMPAPSAFTPPPPDPQALGEALALRFQITEGQIQDAIRAAHAYALFRDPRNPLLSAEDLYEGCRRQASRRLLTFSRRIEPRSQLAFSDLVLPEANLRQLREVQNRIRMMQRVHSELGFEQRLRLAHGMVVLFTGSSGTGKTMAAEWLARELGVDLYKADLSSVVSKWVGETEKNLHQLFAEAEDSSAIIFFDEADALFGKRGEVKDARDRWANTEVNYLLQRIEEYAGVVILASNLRQNIDEAFLRRISAMVEFPSPDEAARVQIWRGMFPPGLAHPSDEELRSLAARIKLPGGSVRNIVVDAAFRAAASAGPDEPVVTLRHLVVASAREFQKLGRPLTKTELGDIFYRWVEEDVL